MPRSSADEAELTRRRIVDATAARASVDGFSHVSVRAVAKHVGLSSSGTLGPFASRESLVADALDSAIDAFVGSVVAPTATLPDGEVRLRALIDRWVDYLANCPFPGGCVVTAASVDLDGCPGALRDRLTTAVRQWRAVLAQQFRAAGATRAAAADRAVTLIGIAMAVNQEVQLLGEPGAARRGRRMMRAVLDRPT